MTESTLDRAAEGLYRELARLGGNPARLPEAVRPIALLYAFQGMVDNGGFRYPLESDAPGSPPYSIFSDAYRRIGAPEAAAALDRAVSLFPFEHPEQNADARNEFMNEFDQLSDTVCGDENIWKLMNQYVERHIRDFAPFITQ